VIHSPPAVDFPSPFVDSPWTDPTGLVSPSTLMSSLSLDIGRVQLPSIHTMLPQLRSAPIQTHIPTHNQGFGYFDLPLTSSTTTSINGAVSDHRNSVFLQNRWGVPQQQPQLLQPPTKMTENANNNNRKPATNRNQRRTTNDTGVDPSALVGSSESGSRRPVSEKRREQFRQAATRFRVRQLARVQELERQIDTMGRQNEQFKAEEGRLIEEIAQVRNLISMMPPSTQSSSEDEQPSSS
jgi:hypothetical protein